MFPGSALHWLIGNLVRTIDVQARCELLSGAWLRFCKIYPKVCHKHTETIPRQFVSNFTVCNHCPLMHILDKIQLGVLSSSEDIPVFMGACVRCSQQGRYLWQWCRLSSCSNNWSPPKRRLDSWIARTVKFLRHIQSYPSCICGHTFDDAYHYILICPIYSNIRQNEYFYTNNITITNILHGVQYDVNTTKLIFESLHRYLSKTKRFTQ